MWTKPSAAEYPKRPASFLLGFQKHVFSRVTSALLNLSLSQLRKRNGKEKGREEERERKKGNRTWKKEKKNRREEH